MSGGARAGAEGRPGPWRVVAAAIAVLGGLVGTSLLGSDLAGASGGEAPQVGSLLLTADELAALPTAGPAWDALRTTADRALTSNLADQDDLSPASALAAALVHARTGSAEHRQRVEAALAALPGTEVGGRTLSLGRQLAGWVLAADLIGYREPSFVQWVAAVRTAMIGGHGRWVTLQQTHETTSSNWGAFAGASRVAASLYLGDRTDVEAAARVFRGWLGDPAAWPTLAVGETGQGFSPTADFDPSWTCSYPDWRPVNEGCGDRQGALVEDISRGDPYPAATTVGLSYSWEALQGATLQAILLGRNGYPDVWTWENGALARAVGFLADHGGFEASNFNRVNHWVPAAIDQVYGTSFARGPAGSGRNFGFTDWLPVGPTTTGPTTAVPATSTTTTSINVSTTIGTSTTSSTSTTVAPSTSSTTSTTSTTSTSTTSTTIASRTRVRIARQECRRQDLVCVASAPIDG